MPIQSNVTTRGSGLCLLSLDSSGPRGISQLTTLVQLMHRLNYDSHDDQPSRPCNTFDMIGGVGSGGFIAIILVIFGPTAEKALDEFMSIRINVLEKWDVDVETRTAALKEYIERLLERYGIDLDNRILDSGHRSMNCKLAIPISYRHHAGSTCVLRNYSVRKEQTPNLTIAEALMVTLATLPMFTPTQILKDAATFEYMGADWTLSNPVEEIITEAYEALGAEQRVACLLSLGCGNPGVFVAPTEFGTVAWKEFLEVLVTDSERKAKMIDWRMGHLGFYHRFSVSSGLERTTTTTCIHPVNTVTHTQVYLDDATVSRKMDACAKSLRIRDGVSSLEQLQHTGGRTTLSPQLPPLTTSFVMRKEPWEFVKKVLLDDGNRSDKDGPRMLILTGIGGCGKTQLMLRFMKEYRSRFTSRIFIDGSSEDRIRADILRNVRSLGIEHSQKSFEDCLLFLSQPLETCMWLLVYDNVDDPDLDLSSLLPRGDSCEIAVTSRNSLLGDLHPEGHLQLGIMALQEAVELLLYGYTDPHNQTRIDAATIAEALGCLPIALQQARAYMRQTKCSARTYFERLSTNREKVLRQPIKYQLDSRAISTYAAFETSFSKLPESSKKVLRLLSCFHWSGFPLELIVLAAQNQFSKYEETDAPHTDDFDIGKSVLEDIFLINGEWDVTNLDIMILSLRNYSLVSVISGVDTLLLQIHPLVHQWVHTCTPEKEKHDYQPAAILLLALGARDERTPATQYLASHVTHMSSLWRQLSLNNATAFRSILDLNGVYRGAMELQELIMEMLRQCPDICDEKLQQNAWYLADLYSKLGRLNEAEALQTGVLKLSKDSLGEHHPDTISSSNNLAITYRTLGRLEEAEGLQSEVLELRKEILGKRHPDTISASESLANTYRDLGRLHEAEALQRDVQNLRREILGERHPDTIGASNNLAITCRKLGRLNEAEALKRDVLMLSREILGDRHPDTISVSNNLALIYCDLGRLSEAEALQRDTLKLSKEILGERHPETIRALSNLAVICRELGRLNEAETILTGALKVGKEILEQYHLQTSSAFHHPEIFCSKARTLKVTELEQVSRDRGRSQAERHPLIILASSDLTTVLRLQGKLHEAEVLAEKVLQHQSELFGDQHHDTHFFSYRLAAIYHDQGRFNEAESRLLDAIDPMQKILGSKHHKTTAIMLLLAKVYRSLHKIDDARELLTAAEPIISDTLGNTHHQYLELQQILSSLPTLVSIPDATPPISQKPLQLLKNLWLRGQLWAKKFLGACF